ncbi:TIGR03745 family integrating conjugative element membrane protein [Vibrio pectenicida]|nr:TIGR03745 family integrating conjugative element membrane protein [Vibrio pectenicida]
MKILTTFTRTLLGAMTMASCAAQAKIPKNQDPTQGDSDNLLELIFYYAYDIVLYGGCIFVAFCALYYLGHVWDIYSQTRDGKKTKKELLTDAIIGGMLILLSVWGLNYSLNILGSI